MDNEVLEMTPFQLMKAIEYLRVGWIGILAIVTAME
jgi:hypothetical protein